MADADPAALVAALRERLTGAGGPFELVPAEVGGVELPVFAHRRAALRDWLVDSATFGDREFLVQGDRRLTFAEHLDAVASLADVLADEYGVAPGDRVAILGSNSPDWIVSFWAAITLGAVAVAGNAWWTAREAHYSLGRARPKVVITDGKRAPLLEGSDLAVLRMEDLPRAIAARGAAPVRSVVADADEPAVIMYTSGTTGHPKGAVHSHRNLLAVIEYHRYTDAIASEMAAAFGLPARAGARRYLMSLPLFHIASLHNLVLPRLATGDTVVIDADRFDVDRVLRLVERESITNWAVVPDDGPPSGRARIAGRLRPVLAGRAVDQLRSVVPGVEGPGAGRRPERAGGAGRQLRPHRGQHGGDGGHADGSRAASDDRRPDDPVGRGVDPWGGRSAAAGRARGRDLATQPVHDARLLGGRGRDRGGTRRPTGGCAPATSARAATASCSWPRGAAT